MQPEWPVHGASVAVTGPARIWPRTAQSGSLASRLHARFRVRGVSAANDDPVPFRSMGDGPARADAHPAQLRAAVDACREVLADYEAGLLTDVEARRALFRVGLVRGNGEAWCLDLERGAWQRYDGISLRDTSFRVSSSNLARWRGSLDAVGAELTDLASSVDGEEFPR
jgi:hypothetical protein